MAFYDIYDKFINITIQNGTMYATINPDIQQYYLEKYDINYIEFVYDKISSYYGSDLENDTIIIKLLRSEKLPNDLFKLLRLKIQQGPGFIFFKRTDTIYFSLPVLNCITEYLNEINKLLIDKGFKTKCIKNQISFLYSDDNHTIPNFIYEISKTIHEYDNYIIYKDIIYIKNLDIDNILFPEDINISYNNKLIKQKNNIFELNKKIQIKNPKKLIDIIIFNLKKTNFLIKALYSKNIKLPKELENKFFNLSDDIDN